MRLLVWCDDELILEEAAQRPFLGNIENNHEQWECKIYQFQYVLPFGKCETLREQRK